MLLLSAPSQQCDLTITETGLHNVKSIGFSSPEQPDIPVTLLLGVHLSAIPDPACAQHACVTVAQTSEKSAKLIERAVIKHVEHSHAKQER